MKKTLYEILESMTPEELDLLPEDVFQADVPDDITVQHIRHIVAEKTGVCLADTARISGNKTNTRKTLRRIAAAAVCSILLLGAGVGTYAYAASQKEYKNALAFFYDNNLSTKGLTKTELKKVYRDFFTFSFANDLTTNVILNSRPDIIPGHEISGDETEWDTTMPSTSISDYKTPLYYEYASVFAPIEGTKKEVFEKSTFTKYRNNEKIWEIDFTDFSINGYYCNTESEEDPVLVYGTQPYTSDITDKTARLVALDVDGTILWEVVQNNSSDFDQIQKVLRNSDGTYMAFGRCGNNNEISLCVNKYDKDGKPVFSKLLEINDHAIEHVTPSETGYLLHLSSYVTIEFSRVVKLDFEGNIVGDFRYDSEESDFYISNLSEYDGIVYISGYSTPKAPEKVKDFRQRNIFMLKSTLADTRYADEAISDEELLALFRKQFTAVLLVCEPDSGTPKEFYSVAGSVGDEVYVTDSTVCWFTKDIIDSDYSYTPVIKDGIESGRLDTKYAALCRFYANIFNTDGTFREQKKLDLMTELKWGY